jgi:AcrR family transcriptional regulator
MVERIVAAAETVVCERGYEGATTNHIAASAQISPGSLYQYFPHKDAILAEVLDRYVDRLEARVSHAFVSALAQPVSPYTIRGVLVAMLDSFEENPTLLRVLIDQLSRVEGSRRARFAHRMDELLTTALTLGQRGRPRRSSEAAAWILVRMVEHVTISYTLERPPISRDIILDELTSLIIDYINDAATA